MYSEQKWKYYKMSSDSSEVIKDIRFWDYFQVYIKIPAQVFFAHEQKDKVTKTGNLVLEKAELEIPK